MMKKYRTKVDVWLVGVIVGVVGGSVLPVLWCDFSWLTVIVVMLALLLTLYVVFSITYTIEGDVLTVKNGFFYSRRYDINDIIKIKNSKSLISAPASSLDRIEIYFTGRKMPLIISPKKKMDFVNELKSVKPDILCDVKG